MIQVRPGSSRILVPDGVPQPMVALATLPTQRKGFPPLMDRRVRAFHPAAQPLEGRILLARVNVSPAATQARTVLVAPLTLTPTSASNGAVWFLGTPSSGATTQVVQQGGEATIWLRGYTAGGPLQVQVTTDPSSPAVGVNLPAVNQTVTIPGGESVKDDAQNLAYLTIPTSAGAPNPSEVDVNLTITPIDPPAGVTVQGGPLELRILAPDATTPPRIIGEVGTPYGIQLMFSKPMNPAQASNVHNYTVRETYTTISGKDDFLDSTPIQYLSPDAPLGGSKTSISTKLVPLRAANYDPADFTVTLVPKRKLSYIGTVAVTPGSPAKTSAAHRHGSSPSQGLTDVEGNAINQPGGKPGKFWVRVTSGYTPWASGTSVV